MDNGQWTLDIGQWPTTQHNVTRHDITRCDIQGPGKAVVPESVTSGRELVDWLHQELQQRKVNAHYQHWYSIVQNSTAFCATGNGQHVGRQAGRLYTSVDVLRLLLLRAGLRHLSFVCVSASSLWWEPDPICWLLHSEPNSPIGCLL